MRRAWSTCSSRLPAGVEDRRLRETLRGVAHGETVTVLVEVGEHRIGRNPARPYRVVVEGGGQTFELVYFRPKGDWIQRALPPGGRRIVSGRIEFYDGRLQMPHPELVLAEDEAATLRPWEPVYPLTQGLTQRTVARAVATALTRLPSLPEWIAPAMLAERHWPAWADALRAAHAPEGPGALSPADPARQRLAYDELLSHQLALQLVRARMKRRRGRANAGDGRLRVRALAAFGHSPTGAQGARDRRDRRRHGLAHAHDAPAARRCRLGQDAGRAGRHAGGGRGGRAGRADGADRDPRAPARRRPGTAGRAGRRPPDCC